MARRLHDAGVIESTRRFNTMIEYSGAGGALRAGEYRLQRDAPTAEVLSRLQAGPTESDLNLLAIPEGLRLEEIGELLRREGLATVSEWADALAGPRPDAVLAGRPEGASLLGYLLPASYALGCGTPPTADALAAEMVGSLAAALDELGAELAASALEVHTVLTLAAIVEKEAVMADERPLIASVLLNRIEIGMALQVDPTVQFAAATAEQGARGWWPEVLAVDLELDSPYNTYRYAGLPPGPIANPGIDAIRAVLQPAASSFLYFVARCDGSERHQFAETAEQHHANVAICHG